MASLTLKDIPTQLMERLRARAAAQRRSLNREAILLLEQALEPSGALEARIREEREGQLAAWRALAGRWQGPPEETDRLIEDIYRSRTPGRDVSL